MTTAALTTRPHNSGTAPAPPPVPAGVDPGTAAPAALLDEITPEIERLVDRLRNTPDAGWLVTAADRQRLAEVRRLAEYMSRILAERY